MDKRQQHVLRCAVIFFGLFAASQGASAQKFDCQSVTISLSALPSAIPAGQPFSAKVTASGGTPPYDLQCSSNEFEWDEDGNMWLQYACPGGTTLGFSWTASDANGCTATKDYHIAIEGCCQLQANGGDGVATLGAAYKAYLTSFGVEPYTFVLAAGSLPPGLTLSGYGNPDGKISGTPTATGTYNFTLSVTDSVGCWGSQPAVIRVACYAGITLWPATLPGGSPGLTYDQTVAASGGAGGYTYSATGLGNPPRLTIDTYSGEITGMLVPGQYDFTVTATDVNGCAGSKEYSFWVNCPQPPITISPTSIPTGSVGVHYETTFSQTGGVAPIEWDYAPEMPLPDGMSFAGGALWGSPTQAGVFPLEIYATDVYHCAAILDVTLTIGSCPAISLSPSFLPNGTVGSAYSQAITASGGTPGYAYSLTGGWLPGGLSLSPAGVLSGTPTTRGNFTIKATALDSAGCTGNTVYTLTINSTVATPIETAVGYTRNTAQTWNGKNAQIWPPNPQAASYVLHRGQKANLPNLLNGNTDSCTCYQGTTNSATTADDPTSLGAGDFYWYLVAGVNGNGEGYAGNALVGGQLTPRAANSTGTCP
jgi:hypothetical protein